MQFTDDELNEIWIQQLMHLESMQLKDVQRMELQNNKHISRTKRFIRT